MKTFLTSPGKEASGLYLCSQKAGMLFFFLMQVILSSSPVLGQRVSWLSDYEKYKPTHHGKHFILGIPSLGKTNYISLRALFKTNVTISTMFSKSIFSILIDAGKAFEYKVPDSLLARGSGWGQKGLEINSTQDIAVVVLLRDKSPDSDAFLALPTNVLGKEYVLPSWNVGTSRVLIVSRENDTIVKVKLRLDSGNLYYEGHSYYDGAIFSKKFQKLETVCLVRNVDLSGTIVTANKPIAVISAKENTRVYGGNFDNMATFLLPVKHWGKKFMLPNVGSLNNGNIFRVFVAKSNTIVVQQKSKSTLHPRNFKQINRNNGSYISCSKPCQVVMYTKGQRSYDSFSHVASSMINLPSTDHYLPFYKVTALARTFYRHSVAIVIKEYAKDGLLVNGQSLSSFTWKTIKGTKFCWIVANLKTNDRVITHSVAGVRFGLLVYGASNSASYGYPGGFTFQKKIEESKACRRKLDLGFVLDSSGSVSTKNYEKMKAFVKDLTSFFLVKPDETRVSVMSFSNDATIHFPLSRQFDDHAELISAIDNVGYTGGGTATALALNKAYQDMFQVKNGARQIGATKVLIILTDGQSNGGVKGPAEKLKQSNVIIFCVGIGQNINMDELNVMASQPKEQRVILLENFQELSSLAKKMSSKACNVSRFDVTCNKAWMSLAYDKSSLPKFIKINELVLNDHSCKPTQNKTHIIAKTNLNGCGTTYRETAQEIIFTNAITTSRNRSDGSVITREKEISLKFSCIYDRMKTVGSFNFLPARQQLTINEKSFGNFTISMNFYTDNTYQNMYDEDDYPVTTSLSDHVYVEYSVDSSNSGVVIRAKSCRATPSNKPNDQPQYVFIDNGCDRDSTIRHATSGLGRNHRFSIQAFSFVTEHRYVYFHCDLILCHKNTAKSICGKSTDCSSRKRRDVGSEDDDTKSYPLSTGPVIYREKKETANSKGESSIMTRGTIIGLLFGVVILALLLILIVSRLVIRKHQNKYDTKENVQVLSMYNMVEIPH